MPGRDGAVLDDQLTQARTDFMQAQGNLAVLPDLTGGRTILNTNEPFKIADESARYNLDPDTMRLDRTINVPMTALHFLRAANQPCSIFRLGRPERVAGTECVTLQFTEQSWPRLIHTRDGAAAQGTFWIDVAGGGRVLKTELRLASSLGPADVVQSQTTITYARIDKVDLWMPIVMDDKYELPASRQTVTGHATYSDFREFKVTTSSDIK